jgi:sugar O-acyltransferase (sialic acid O-acetyltransferase NeuD family)
MRKLVIWGASSHALVVADIVRLGGAYEIVGFLDDVSPERTGTEFGGARVLGGAGQLDVLRRHGVEHLLCAFGDGPARLRCAALARARGYRLATAVHPRAIVAGDVAIGEGTVVAAGAVVNPGTTLGENVVINTSATVEHECTIEDGALVNTGARLGGRVSMGRLARVEIGATVATRTRIGAGSVVGARSLVLRDVPDGVLVHGTPARVIRDVGGPHPRADDARGELDVLRAAVTELHRRQTELSDALTLIHAASATREEVDLLKSSLEVAPSLRDEFLDWKARHPVPARPLVSVCVATFGRAGLLLERCLPSILEQTYEHLEVIVVGDGCTDDTGKRLARVGDPRVTFVNLPARGRYPDDAVRRWMVAGTPAMNHALDLARGDFVTHLGDDDEHQRDRLEKLVAFATAHGCDLVWHPFWWQTREGWEVNEAREFAFAQVTTSSVLYRSWFTRVQWNIDAHRLGEPGDWNRFRRIKYLGPAMMRYPEPLLRHHRERTRTS